MKLLSEALLYLSGFHPKIVERKARTRKKRAFGNGLVLMGISPLFVAAAAHSMNYSPAGLVLRLLVGLFSFGMGFLSVRWSLRPDPPKKD